MKKLLIATNNPGKLSELSKFLSDLPVQLVSLKDIGSSDAVKETGKTFEENAVLKAKYYCQRSGLATLADDGGAEIDALNGEPGVKTRRWIHGDRESTDQELIAYTLKRLEGIPKEKRGMQLRLVLALALPNRNVYLSEDRIRGIVAEKPHGQAYEGFPFRRLMYLPEIGKYYNHTVLTPQENLKYNHRLRALNKIKKFLKEYLTKEAESIQ